MLKSKFQNETIIQQRDLKLEKLLQYIYLTHTTKNQPWAQLILRPSWYESFLRKSNTINKLVCNPILIPNMYELFFKD